MCKEEIINKEDCFVIFIGMAIFGVVHLIYGYIIFV